jgi:hypothetical protein
MSGPFLRQGLRPALRRGPRPSLSLVRGGASGWVLRRLTFELRRPARQDAFGRQPTMGACDPGCRPKAACLVGSPLERGVRPHAEPPLTWPRHLSSWALPIARWFQPPPALASDPRFVVPALPGLQHGHATNSGPAGKPVGGGTRPELARHPLSVPFPRLLALGSRLSALGSRLSALGSRLSALGSRLSVLGSRFSVLGSRFSVLGSRFSVLGSRFSVLGLRSSVFDPQPSGFDPQSPTPWSWTLVLHFVFAFRRLDRLPSSRMRLDLELVRSNVRAEATREAWRPWAAQDNGACDCPARPKGATPRGVASRARG